MTLSRVKMEVLLSSSRVIGGGTLEYTLPRRSWPRALWCCRPPSWTSAVALLLVLLAQLAAGSCGATWSMPAALFLVTLSPWLHRLTSMAFPGAWFSWTWRVVGSRGGCAVLWHLVASVCCASVITAIGRLRRTVCVVVAWTSDSSVLMDTHVALAFAAVALKSCGRLLRALCPGGVLTASQWCLDFAVVACLLPSSRCRCRRCPFLSLAAYLMRSN